MKHGLISNLGAVIKVFGVGGAGVNAVNNMISSGLEGVEFYAANTDNQALNSSLAPNKIRLGNEITKGLGAGADPDIGYAAARESAEEIRAALEGADMVFITAGMGGGTGTLASSVVAEIARDLGCLTVAVVTKPFKFEGRRRERNAERGLEELTREVDTLIRIPNNRLLSVAGRNTTVLEAFKRADDVLFQAVKGISDLIIFEGLVNVDFSDVRTVMAEMGMAMMGTGEARGENRAIEAAEKAISSPLLDDMSIHGARGVLINVTASPDVTLQEVNEAAELVHAEAHEDANIIWGMVIDPAFEDRVRVTVIATGFGDVAEAYSTTSMTKVSARGETEARSFPESGERVDLSAYGKKPQEQQHSGEVVRFKKVASVGGDDDGRYEIPTFLRKQNE
jgi:cell division protein FtsZ